MTPRQENSIERSVGRIEGQIESVAAVLARVEEKLQAADDWRHEVKARLEKMEAHGDSMDSVAEAFAALQKSIHEGTIKATAYRKGVVIGVGVAAGGTGASLATAFKWLWAAITGDPA